MDVRQELEDYGRPEAETLAALRSELHAEFGLGNGGGEISEAGAIGALVSSPRGGAVWGKNVKTAGTQQQLQRQQKDKNKNEVGEETLERVYLVSGRLRDAGQWDLPALMRNLEASLGDAKRNKFALSLDG